MGGVVFPLTSYSGQIVGFQVRSLERKEYDTFALKRRPEGYFFGIGPNMESIWASREICLVEGPPDQLVVERLIRPDVVALTTAGAGTLQMKFLRRFVRRIYLCLDLDKAGRDGVNNFIQQHGSEFDLVNVKYPRLHEKDKDPGDLWKRVGDSAYKRYFKDMERAT
jgi:DNA primase